jgi:uncharacterized SAM-binding protein YcdF (DUF218 family)
MSSDGAEPQPPRSGDGKTWRRSIPLVGAGLLALLAATGWFERQSLLQASADVWIKSDPISRSDAAVVLGGGLQTRPLAVSELYRRGVVSRVLVSAVPTETSDRLGVTEDHTQLNINLLEKLGVPAAAIETFGKDSASTEDEARALRAWIHSHARASFIIPTEIFSTRRVGWIFHHELGPGVRIEVQSLEPPLYGRVGWWRREDGLVAFQNEIVKYLYYRLRY